MNRINTILDIITLLANIVTIGGILYVTYLYIKQSKKLKIYFDETLEMLTSHKKLEKILIRLIKYPEKIHTLNIITKSKKTKRHNEIPFVVVEKRTALRNMKKIKRGIAIIIHEVIHDECTFNSTLVNSFFDFVRNYINFVKNIDRYPEGNGDVFEVTTKYDTIDLSAKIRLSGDIATSVKENIMNGLPGQRSCSFDIIKESDKTIRMQVMYDFILSLSQEDKYWDGDNFLHKEKLMRIFMSSSWEVGMA
jgi:hypothetical protein